jgi:hypothetical protein
MKKYILKCLIFGLPVVAWCFACVVLLTVRSGNTLLADDVTTIICGDSHTRRALNDRELPNTFNASNSAESYFFTYQKIKKYVESNDNLSTVILGFAPHSISGFYDTKLAGDKITSMYLKYYPVLDSDAKKYMRDNTKGSLTFRTCRLMTKGLVKWMCCSIIRKNQPNLDEQFDWLGGFGVLQSQGRWFMPGHYYDVNGEMYPLSIMQIQYLEKIALVCDRHGLELILVNTPVSPDYDKYVPEVYKVEYATLKANLRNRYEVLDYGNLFESKLYFHDIDHLNGDGAHLFTEIICEQLGMCKTNNLVSYGLDWE